jgi:Fic family protein
MKERNAYYAMLEKTQGGDGDCTEWLLWFIGCFDHALSAAESLLSALTVRVPLSVHK